MCACVVAGLHVGFRSSAIVLLLCSAVSTMSQSRVSLDYLTMPLKGSLPQYCALIVQSCYCIEYNMTEKQLAIRGYNKWSFKDITPPMMLPSGFVINSDH